MGAILERSGLAERLLNAIGMLLGPLKGGVAAAVVLVGTSVGGRHGRGRRHGDRDGSALASDHDPSRL